MAAPQPGRLCPAYAQQTHRARHLGTRGGRQRDHAPCQPRPLQQPAAVAKVALNEQVFVPVRVLQKVLQYRFVGFEHLSGQNKHRGMAGERRVFLTRQQLVNGYLRPFQNTIMIIEYKNQVTQREHVLMLRGYTSSQVDLRLATHLVTQTAFGAFTQWHNNTIWTHVSTCGCSIGAA